MNDEAEQLLEGGMGNAGAVVRVGDTVRRPSGPFGPQIRAYLAALAEAGFEASRPEGLDEQGREIAPWIGGEVPVPPFPHWSMTDDVLEGVARLLRRFHDVSATIPVPAGPWSPELGEPSGGPMMIHNDVCPENVVFRDGEPVALLDFDFAAPGTREWDVIATVRMWGPVGDPVTFDPERRHLDPLHRYRTFVQAYGVGVLDADRLVETLYRRRAVGEAFVRGRMAAGEQAFIDIWNGVYGEERHANDLAWFDAHRSDLAAAAR